MTTLKNAPQAMLNAWRLLPDESQKDLHLMAEVATQVVLDILARTDGDCIEPEMVDSGLGK